MPSSLGWTCTKCTYKHRVPGNRCVMCNELRVTREHMRDFVLGKPIPEECKPGPLHVKKNPYLIDSNNNKPMLSSQDKHHNESSHSAASAALPATVSIVAAKSKPNHRPAPAVLNNPYAKKQKTQQQNQQQQCPIASSSRPPSTTMNRGAAPSAASETTASTLAANSIASTVQQTGAEPFSSSSNTSLNNHSPSSAPFQVASNQQALSFLRHAPKQAPQTSTSVSAAQVSITSSTSTTTTSVKPSSSGSSNASIWNPSRSGISSTTILSNHSTNQHQQQRRQQQQQKRPAPQQKQHQQLAPAHSTNPAPPFVRAVRPVFQPGPVPFDPITTHEWIYPVSETYAKRQYQLEISQTAVLHNTLVSLPTGLGKTLIAAVVMYNYYRWFPTGKVIFLAPTQPLVKQQVGACHDIMGFLPADTAVLTGNTAADKRTHIWKSRRVFYCTPQTVQRDLDANRLDARQVVCLVLDEAHKATGDYAYVKIVEHLKHVGAKFRLLALSATPGTSLAAIQQVVYALQINRIEARTDEDPTVAPYIHRRDTEYIVVPQTSMAKKVEYALNDIVSPLLSKLRSSGALRSAGYATVTTYTLLRATQEYKKRENKGDHGGSMLGYFIAAQHFVQMRTDLQKHGLGMVRTKLQRLRQERNRGPMASIVRGKEFATLWERVQEASGCDSSQQENANVKEKLAQNPKLAALVQVLTEHFERHRGGRSTRVIVFSQWRDSVSEIVSVLETYQPLIRPRCFVGQNAGTNKTNEKGKLKGMKQAEQQEVIRQFREDVYNVLVCTSIGEEGLDIGQVDLIGCFDVLRSPIRSLQRIGRTGRKRAGKVVVFVSEGQEEITLKSSKQSERNLAHALRNPKSFKVTPTVRMFLSTPTLSEQTMSIGKNFRMSQVEGIEVPGKRLDRMSLEDRSSASRAWKLTAEQERHRLLVLGECGSVTDGCHGNSGLSSSLLRRFRLGRSISHCLQKDLPLGRSAKILRHIEKVHRDKETTDKEETSGMSFLQIGRRGDPSMRVFPLMPLDANEEPANFSCLQQFLPREQESDVQLVSSTEFISASVPPAYRHAAQNKENEPNSAHPLPSSDDAKDYLSREGTSYCPDADVIDRPQILNVVNPYAAPKHTKGDDNLNSAQLQAENPNASSLGRLDGAEECQRSVVQSGSDKVACVYPDHLSLHQENPSPTDQGKVEEIVVDEFVLHSQDDSDSETEESQIVDPKQSNLSKCDVFRGTSTNSSSAVGPISTERKTCETSGDNTSLEHIEPRHSWESDLDAKLPALSPNINDISNKNEKCCNSANEEQSNDFVLPSQGSNSDADEAASVVSVEDTRVSEGDVVVKANGDDFVLPSQDSSSSDDSESDDEIVCRRNRADERSPFHCSGDDLCDTQSCQPSQRSQKQTPRPSNRDDLCDTQSCQRPRRFQKQTHSHSRKDDLCDMQSCHSSQRFGRQRPPYSSGGDLCDTQSCQASQLFRQQTHLHSSGDDLCDTQSCQPSQQIRDSRPAQSAAESLLSDGNELSARLPPAKKRRRLAIQQFFEEEARIDSDDDMDGDKSESSEIRRIEEEEQDIDGFINDSSQLGFSLDALDEADPETVHKALDMQRAKKQQFATPVFNRRMKGAKNRDSWIGKTPDSASGLGNMHFIRSVLEHHKQGGRAEDIEQFYHELEAEE